MIDEQIKRNAEEYAYEHMVRTDGDGFEEEYDYKEQYAAYIAGAHSRDEEVEMLQNQIEELSEQLKMNAENIQKLRKPWISVEERLPAKYETVLVKTGRGNFYLAEKDSVAQPRDEFAIPQLSSYVNGVTHWMPIPELKK